MRKFIEDGFNVIVEQKIIDDLILGTTYVLLFMPYIAFYLVEATGNYSLGVLVIVISALVIAAKISSHFKLISDEELFKQFPDVAKAAGKDITKDSENSEDIENDNKDNNDNN